ncbi:MAG: molybdopterin molybdotransferase MoeA [Erythrobacter sp.]
MAEALALEEAQARLLALAPALPSEVVACGEALGRFLAEDLHAARTQPPADLSAMDGYALCGEGPGPWQRVGESRAGAPFEATLTPGQCVRISTGAHVPMGADRVLLQEDAAIEGDRVTAAETPPAGRHIRPRGFDFCEGSLLIERGTVMTPARIALAVAAGRSTLAVARPPHVAILDTGDELAADPAQCAPHQIPASNGAMLAAMLAPLGCTITRLGPVGDDYSALAAALAKAEQADIVITSGGASVGDHDLVQEALARWGAQIAFWKVAMKPGKPMMVATRPKPGAPQLVIGLPGNPVSCFVTAFLMALPVVRASMGARPPLPVRQPFVMAEPLPPVGKRREFLRAALGPQGARLVGSQDSSALASLAEANCLIDRAAQADALPAGSPVTGFMLHNG